MGINKADTQTDALLSNAGIRIPDHVVFREFVRETVILNIASGQYFGLNRTAGRMLHAIQSSARLGEALSRLEGEFPDAGRTLRDDFIRFCRLLAQRDLLIILEDPS